MTTQVKPDTVSPPTSGASEILSEAQNASAETEARLSSAQVWRELSRASFAVVSHVTPAGEPRSSGVIYKTVGQRLYLVVAPNSWKARHIAINPHVAVTVPVRRGGLLALIFPIPPATISFHAQAVVQPAGPLMNGSMGESLASLVPPERRDDACLIELIPEGQFLTYGIGVSLSQMRDPAISRARVPVGRP